MVSARFGWQLLRFEWKPVAFGLLYTSYKTSLRCLFSLHPDPLDRRVTATHYTIGNRWWKELLKPLRCSSRILMCAKFKPTKMSRKQKDKQTNSNVRQWNLKKIMWLTGRSAAKFSESIWSWVCLVAFHDWLSMPRFFFFFFVTNHKAYWAIQFSWPSTFATALLSCYWWKSKLIVVVVVVVFPLYK